MGMTSLTPQISCKISISYKGTFGKRSQLDDTARSTQSHHPRKDYPTSKSYSTCVDKLSSPHSRSSSIIFLKFNIEYITAEDQIPISYGIPLSFYHCILLREQDLPLRSHGIVPIITISQYGNLSGMIQNLK